MTNSKRKPGVFRGIKVATLNTRVTLFELEAGCNKYNINVVGIQEHRRQTIDSTELEETENGELFIFSTANNRSQGGVGLFLDQMAKKRLISYERVSDRIIYALFDANPPVLVVSAYSPTNCPGNELEVESFYQDLERLISATPPHQ